MPRVSSIRQLLESPEQTDSLHKQLKTLTDAFHSDLILTLNDITRYFQSAVRLNDKPRIQSALSALDEQIPTIDSLFDDLTSLHSTYFDKVLSTFQPSEPNPWVAVLHHYGAFVQTTTHKFLDILWRFCERRLETPSPDDTKAFVDTRAVLIHRIKCHQKSLEDLHWHGLQRLHGLHVSDGECGAPCGQDALECVGSPFFALIRESRASYLPLMHRFWGQGRSIELRRLVIDGLDNDLNCTEKTAKFVLAVDPPLADAPFFARECALLYGDLVERVTSFWGLAHGEGHSEKQAENVAVFGQFVVDILHSENEAKQLMPLAGVARLFQRACAYHDAGAVEEMGQRILVPLLDGVVYRIAEMRARELRLLWELPKRFERDGDDQPELPQAEVDARKAAFHLEYGEQSAELEREALLYADVLDVCHRGVFAYEQRWPAGARPPRPFPDFVERERAAVGKAADFIERSLAKTRDRLFSAIREDPAYARMTDEEIFAVMQFDEVLQVESLEKSMVRTERELALSRRNLLMVAVRRLDLDAARDTLQALRDGHGREIARFAKKRSNLRRDLDVRSVRSIDAKIAGTPFSEAKVLIPCFDDAIRDVVEGTVWNYQQNVADIEQAFAREKDALDRNKAERKKELAEQGRQVRQAVEKKRTIASASVDHRIEATFRDVQDRIRVLLDEKNYSEADAEKKRLDALLREVREKTRFESVRSEKVQQRTSGEKSQRDVGAIEQMYDRKLLRLTQERDRLLAEQKKFFPSQLNGQIRKLVGWMIQLYPQGMTKKEYLIRYEKLAKTIVAENHLDELMQ